MSFFLAAILVAALSDVDAQVAIRNTSCTVPFINGTLLVSAVGTACRDQVDTTTCASLFAGQPFDFAAIFPYGAQAGSGYRPQSLTNPTASCEDPGHISAAIKICPKFCGFCCLTPEYNCKNISPSPIPCDQVTQDMCVSPQWKPVLAQYCPATCGYCLAGGCVDAVTGCDLNSGAICFTMPDFAVANCMRTCNKCGAGPTPCTATGK